MVQAEPAGLTPHVRVMQIIIAALVLGALAFLAIAIFHRAAAGPPADPPIVSYLAVAFALFQLFIQAVLAKLALTAARHRIVQGKAVTNLSNPKLPAVPGETGKLLATYQTVMLLQAAPREGAGFFFIIAYMIEGSLIALAGAVVCIASLAILFPSQNAVANWLERQQHLLEAERHNANLHG